MWLSESRVINTLYSSTNMFVLSGGDSTFILSQPWWGGLSTYKLLIKSEDVGEWL